MGGVNLERRMNHYWEWICDFLRFLWRRDSDSAAILIVSISNRCSREELDWLACYLKNLELLKKRKEVREMEKVTRREVLKAGVYVAPLILTLKAFPAFAARGSGNIVGGGGGIGNHGKRKGGKDGEVPQ